MRLLGDDAEPHDYVVAELNLRAHLQRGQAFVVARDLALRGFIEFLREEGARLVPFPGGSREGASIVPTLGELTQAAAAEQLWLNLTAAGRRELAKLVATEAAEDFWRVEEFPAEKRVVVYAMTPELADHVARIRVTRVTLAFDQATRAVELDVAFVSRGISRLGVRVTYRWH